MPAGVYERTEEHNRRNSESKREYWTALSEEKRGELLDNSFHGMEARRKSKRSTQIYWDNTTLEERQQFGLRVSEAMNGPLARWSKLSLEEQKAALGRATLITEEIREEGNKSRIRTLTGTPRKPFSEAHLRHLSEARELNWKDPDYVENQRIARGLSPNMTEALLGQLLEQFFPGVWEYTGDFSFSIGGRIPDFTDKVGKRVIESMGGYRHDPEDEENRIIHYRKYGYDCIVVWADCRDDIIVQWPEIARRLYEGSTYRVEKKGGPTRILRL